MKKEEILFLGIVLVLGLFLVPVGGVGSGSYNVSNPATSSGGNASSTSYVTGVVIEDVSGNATSSSYSMGIGFEYTVGHSISQTNITLNSGWNLISLIMRQEDSDTDRNISLVAGWNLIGYSSNNSFALANSKFTNSDGTEYTWANAVANNQISAYLAYYDNTPSNPGERKYKYVATSDLSMDDTMLRTNKGYWLYANQSGNLTLPGVGGSYSNATYAWSRLRFRNSSGTELNITDAGSASYNWINIAYIQYWDTSEDGFRYVCSATGIGSPDPDNCLSTSFNPWQGYFIYSNYDNITLLRQN